MQDSRISPKAAKGVRGGLAEPHRCRSELDQRANPVQLPPNRAKSAQAPMQGMPNQKASQQPSSQHAQYIEKLTDFLWGPHTEPWQDCLIALSVNFSLTCALREFMMGGVEMTLVPFCVIVPLLVTLFLGGGNVPSIDFKLFFFVPLQVLGSTVSWVNLAYYTVVFAINLPVVVSFLDKLYVYTAYFVLFSMICVNLFFQARLVASGLQDFVSLYCLYKRPSPDKQGLLGKSPYIEI